jgi:hypothetical protein
MRVHQWKFENQVKFKFYNKSRKKVWCNCKHKTHTQKPFFSPIHHNKYTILYLILYIVYIIVYLPGPLLYYTYYIIIYCFLRLLYIYMYYVYYVPAIVLCRVQLFLRFFIKKWFTIITSNSSDSAIRKRLLAPHQYHQIISVFIQ